MQKHEKLAIKPFSHEGWLRKATNDLQSAKKLIQGDDIIPDTAIYHTQQCAEKALKAFLVFKKQPVIKTHDLEKLTFLCAAFEKSFESLISSTETLNPYCDTFRYPDNFFEPDMEDVVEAIKHAENILSFVKKVIQENLNPTEKLFSA